VKENISLESGLGKAVLLYNGECDVCRRIGGWVRKSAESGSGASRIIERPIGDDPDELRRLNPKLSIWDAYETIHLLMPDGSMKLGGEAVAEVLRRLPNTRWFAWMFAVKILGFRPFQSLLNVGYAILSAVRPLFGCESCGMPIHKRPFVWLKDWWTSRVGGPRPAPHFSKNSAPQPGKR